MNEWMNEYMIWATEITYVSADDKGQFLFQRLSIAVEWFNAILLHESFVSDDTDKNIKIKIENGV